jgi:hypothetical protein
MNSRFLILPAAVLAAAAFVAVPDAEAGPAGAKIGVAFHGPHIQVRGRVGVPIGRGGRVHHGGHYRDMVTWVGGHYETRTRHVRVPGRQIGWDAHGRPVYSGSRLEVQTYQVWVPRRRVVQRVWVPARGGHVHGPRVRGGISIGGGIRVR